MSIAQESSTFQDCVIVLDGRILAKQIEQELYRRVENIKAKTGRTPSLVTILVGSFFFFFSYVRMKGNACKRVGIDSI